MVRTGLWAVALAAACGAEPADEGAAVDGDKPTPLFDGRTLGDWRPTEFLGRGEVKIADGRLILEAGEPMTGVTYGKAPVAMNYEIALEAMRVSGNDFFCGLTFPVGESSCSLIVGGWGGGLVGLSSLNGADASENDTASWRKFEDNRWYRIRLRVEPGRIQAWIDDEKVVDAETTDRSISIRPEVERSRPLGIATYRTTAAIRSIAVRRIGASAPRGDESN
jgi:hypothetical protein